MALQPGVPYTLTSASPNNPTAFLSDTEKLLGTASARAKDGSNAKWTLEFVNQPDGTTTTSIKEMASGLYLNILSPDITKAFLDNEDVVSLRGGNNSSAQWTILTAFDSDPAKGYFQIVAPPIDHLPGEYVVSLDDPSDLNLVLAHPNLDDPDAAQLQSWSFIL